VRRITWGDTCARVIRVGKLTKPGPYFGNPSVLVDVYSLDGQLKDQAAGLPVPGTYKTWRKIEPPDWARSANLRPLDDPELDAALAHQTGYDDAQGHKGVRRHVHEGAADVEIALAARSKQPRADAVDQDTPQRPRS
jgi:hypothetical protein